MEKMKMHLQKLLMPALVICSLIPASVYAVSEGPVGSAQMNDEVLLFQDIPSVYSASKYEQKVTEAPSSISIVTADEIRKYHYRTLADILRSLRGFYTSYDRNYAYLGVRGFARPGDYNTRILLLVDGHRMNENIYDSIYIDTAFLLDVDTIDRVEVIRGPGSSIYGSNALFAVINVITKRGRDLKGLEVSGEAGSLRTYKKRLSYGNRFENGMEMLLSATAYESAGNDRLYFREFDDPATHNGIAVNSDHDQMQNFFGKLSFQDFTLQGARVEREKKIPTAPWGIVFNDPRTEATDQRQYVDLKYEHRFENELDAMARIFYDAYSYSGDYVYDIADYAADPSSDPNIMIFKDRSPGQWFGGEFQLTRRFLEKHRAILGAEIRENTRQDQQNYDATTTYLDDRRDSTNWAVYLQDEFQIFNDLIFYGGVRYDHYDTFGTTTNPRLALIYNPYQKTTFKLLYGEAFRAPNAYELYYYDGSGNTKSNPNLDPETIKTYELVYEQYIGDHLRGTASGFFYNIKDLITQTTDPADGLIMYDNVSEAKAEGAELELEGKWESGVEGRISYTYQETEDIRTGRVLSNAPKHLAKLNLILPVIPEKLFAGLEEQYKSERETVTGNEAAGYFVTNLNLFYQNLTPGLGLSATLYNLFDKTYGDPGGEEHRQDTIEQDERTFLLKATYAF